MSTPFSSSMSFSSNNHIGKFNREMTALVASKCTSVVGAGVYVIDESKPQPSTNATVCRNARAAIVEKQFGADPTLPGPGQYINPVNEGRDSEGGYKVILSTQKNIGSVKFAGPSNNIRLHQDDNDNKVDTGPGPGQYLDPLTLGRDSDGVMKALLSNQEASRNTVWFRPGAPRNKHVKGDDTPGPGAYLNPLALQNNSTIKGTPNTNFGRCRNDSDAMRKPKYVEISRRKENTPGPGHYIDPMTEGRNSDGEVKALLSNQHTVKTVKFGSRPSSAAPKFSQPKAKPPPIEKNSADLSMAVNVLSNHENAGKTVFAREPYEPESTKKKPYDRTKRPSSAPNSRARDGPGFVVLKGDYMASSKYKNNGGVRWGPPGR